MPELAKHFHVVAIDQRGYNLSGQPEGVENYKTAKLVGDALRWSSISGRQGRDRRPRLGWHGSLDIRHDSPRADRQADRAQPAASPRPLRELATNPQQQKNSQYARNFQKPDAAKHVSVEFLTGWVKDPEARKVYLAAFKRSSIEGMLNYYKANYPRLSR